MSQRQIAHALGISQPAVSQQFRYAPDLEGVHPEVLLDAPRETSSFEFIRFEKLIEQVFGREIDIISYVGLKSKWDDDIRPDTVLL